MSASALEPEPEQDGRRPEAAGDPRAWEPGCRRAGTAGGGGQEEGAAARRRGRQARRGSSQGRCVAAGVGAWLRLAAGGDAQQVWRGETRRGEWVLRPLGELGVWGAPSSKPVAAVLGGVVGSRRNRVVSI